jgi:hypothetical protein
MDIMCGSGTPAMQLERWRNSALQQLINQNLAPVSVLSYIVMEHAYLIS